MQDQTPSSQSPTLDEAMAELKKSGWVIYLIFGPLPMLGGRTYDVRLVPYNYQPGMSGYEPRKGQGRTIPEAIIAAINWKPPVYEPQPSRTRVSQTPSKLEDLL